MTQLLNKPERRYDLDWLKVLVVLNLIPFHAAMFASWIPGFLSTGNKQGLTTGIMMLFVLLIHPVHMPILFFISGASTNFALRFRSGREYVKNRVLRLLIPLITGIIIALPFHHYFWPLMETSSKRGLNHFFTDFLPKFPAAIYGEGNLNWGNLWFIVYLLVISLAALPVILYFRKKNRSPLEQKILNLLHRKNGILLLAIPLAIGQAVLTIKWPNIGPRVFYKDLADTFLYFTCFIYGYLVCSDDTFWDDIDKSLKTSLVFSIILTVLILIGLILGADMIKGRVFGIIFYQKIQGFYTWFWLVVILSLGRRFLNISNGFLKYSSEASYPFYIIHQAVLVVIALYLTSWNAHLLLKYVVLCLTTFLSTLMMYDILVRRTNVTRFLFGMKPK